MKLILFLSFLFSSSCLQAQTSFTYQGELHDRGAPADGTFSIGFSLFTSASGGSQIGTTIRDASLAVSDGVFTKELDFGVEAFNPVARYLEITVNGFAMSPRTKLTASPYSLRTRGIHVDAQNNVGLGTTQPRAKLDVRGDTNVRDRLGVGDPQFLAGQLTVETNNGGAPFAISAISQNDLLATIFAQNEGPGHVLHLVGGSDARLSEGGLFAIGSLSSLNLLMDNNEIMARNNGQASTLFLNADGGEVAMGRHRMHPAFAYGYINSNGAVISSSSNLTSSTRLSTGIFQLNFDVPLRNTDVVITSTRSSASSGGTIQDGVLGVNTKSNSTDDHWDWPFSFVIYRP